MDQDPGVANPAESEPGAILVRFQEGGALGPIFFVHGVAGNVARFQNLLRHLGPGEAIYVLQEQSLHGNRPILNRVEDMAAVYIQEMRKVQAAGPYFIAGYSFGGLIAFEIAQQLQHDGHKVPFVALIDAGQPIFRKDFKNVFLSPRTLGMYLRRVRELLMDPASRPTLWSRMRDETWRMLFLKWGGRIAARSGQALPRTQGVLEAARIQAGVDYQPVHFAGRLSVFRVAERIIVDKFDRFLGWGGLADDIDVYDVPGGHVTVCEEPNVAVLAEKFKLALEKARGGTQGR